MFVITHTHMHICTWTVRWLIGSKCHPVPLGLLRHTFLNLDIKITLDVVLCLNAMADKVRVPGWQTWVASLRAIEAFECGLPGLVRTVEQIIPQRLEELVHCPESLSPLGIPLNREFLLSAFLWSSRRNFCRSSAGPCSNPGSLGWSTGEVLHSEIRATFRIYALFWGKCPNFHPLLQVIFFF